MNRRAILELAKFYVVLDDSVADLDRLFTVLKATFKAGTAIIQLRAKTASAKDILDFSRRAAKLVRGKGLFIVNDRVDIALASQADGVHLGQEDIPVLEARKMLGSDKLIGASCQTLRHLKAAHQQGVDYVGFGSVFKTKTKPGRQPMEMKVLKATAVMSQCPIFFIGGITLQNVSQVLSCSAERIAVTRAICESRDVRRETKNFLKALS